MKIWNLKKTTLAYIVSLLSKNNAEPTYQGATMLACTREDAQDALQTIREENRADSASAYHALSRAVTDDNAGRKGHGYKLELLAQVDPRDFAQAAHEINLTSEDDLTPYGISRAHTQRAFMVPNDYVSDYDDALYKAHKARNARERFGDDEMDAYDAVDRVITFLTSHNPLALGMLAPFRHVLSWALMTTGELCKNPASYMPRWDEIVQDLAEQAQSAFEDWFDQIEPNSSDDREIEEQYSACISSAIDSFTYYKDKAALIHAWYLSDEGCDERLDLENIFEDLRDAVESNIPDVWDYIERYDEMTDAHFEEE